jgi:hypothetical protein
MVSPKFQQTSSSKKTNLSRKPPIKIPRFNMAAINNFESNTVPNTERFEESKMDFSQLGLQSRMSLNGQKDSRNHEISNQNLEKSGTTFGDQLFQGYGEDNFDDLSRRETFGQ